MDIRNPAYNASGTIDCEVNHPDYGWLEFTASPNDPEPMGQKIYNRAVGMNPAAYVAPDPTAEDVAIEAERRVRLGLSHRGVTFSLSPSSIAEITAGVSMARQYIEDNPGPIPDPGVSLAWMDDDGTDASWGTTTGEISMTPNQMIALGTTAFKHLRRIKMKARQIAAMSPIPADFADDSRW